MLSLSPFRIRPERPTGAEWTRGLPLELREVELRRGGTTIFSGVNLTFEPSRRYVIVGPSGAGKSSLLRVLNRLDDPQGGEIRLGGLPLKEIAISEVRDHVGLVFQAPRALPGTVSENLAYPYQVRGETVPDSNRLTASLVEVGLPEGWLTRDVGGLSGGERQRLALAVALGRNPEILVMDEPTSALDPESARLVANALDRRAEMHGMRTIAVTHHRGHAPWLGDTVVRMERGTVVEVGPLGEVLARSESSVWESGGGTGS